MSKRVLIIGTPSSLVELIAQLQAQMELPQINVMDRTEDVPPIPMDKQIEYVPPSKREYKGKQLYEDNKRTNQKSNYFRKK